MVEVRGPGLQKKHYGKIALVLLLFGKGILQLAGSEGGAGILIVAIMEI